MTEIMFFASVREQMGKESMTWDETPITVVELKKRLKDTYGLSNLDHSMIAINEEFVKNDTIIENGDKVAFIQPVSGG